MNIDNRFLNDNKLKEEEYRVILKKKENMRNYP
jgi:hypothetical protein